MRYLFISPHVDDSELMAGGTIARLVEEKNKVDVISLSVIYDGLSLYHEWLDSMQSLGIEDFKYFNFQTRLFHNHADAILQTLYPLAGKYDYVFAPCASDYHSDHSIAAKAAQRAFKHLNLITWLPDWNQRTFVKNYFVKLNNRHVEKKLQALGCYKSQLHKIYFKQDVVVGAMAVNGMMCGAEYAEAFNVVSMTA